MTFARLYQFSFELRSFPVILEGVVDQKAMELSSQDELWYVPCELDEEVSLGHIKQMRQPTVPYDQDALWVTEIRYSNNLNFCWKRYVCCKELMHVFDAADEAVNSPEKFRKLLDELEAPLPSDQASDMFKSETRTMWMALTILCPEPVLERLKPMWVSQEMSDYEVALELRIPEALIKAIMSDHFEEMLRTLRPEQDEPSA